MSRIHLRIRTSVTTVRTTITYKRTRPPRGLCVQIPIQKNLVPFIRQSPLVQRKDSHPTGLSDTTPPWGVVSNFLSTPRGVWGEGFWTKRHVPKLFCPPYQNFCQQTTSFGKSFPVDDAQNRMLEFIMHLPPHMIVYSPTLKLQVCTDKYMSSRRLERRTD